MTSLGDAAFLECFCLESIILPEGLTELNDTFDRCERLSEFTIPESAEVLFNTFNACSSLTRMTVPENVREIDFAFDHCTSLKTVTFLGTGLRAIGLGAFHDCASLESLAVPDGVEEIGVSAFEDCVSLKSVTLPDSLEYIDMWAFKGCSALREISCRTGSETLTRPLSRDVRIFGSPSGAGSIPMKTWTLFIPSLPIRALPDFRKTDRHSGAVPIARK